MTSTGVRLLGALLAAATELSLSACTPALKPLLAVAYRDDEPTVLLADCAKSTIDWLHVYEPIDPPTDPPTGPSSDPAPTVGLESMIWRTVGQPAGPRAAVPAQVALLEVPPGWTRGANTLTDLDANRDYVVSGGSGVLSMTFTVTDLRRLLPGQVLVDTGAKWPEARTEKQFRDRAATFCD